jgi:hypothetical protein
MQDDNSFSRSMSNAHQSIGAADFLSYLLDDDSFTNDAHVEMIKSYMRFKQEKLRPVPTSPETYAQIGEAL